MKSLSRIILAAVLVMLLMIGYAFYRGRSTPIVTIENQSLATLTQVVLMGTGWKQSVSDLSPESTVRVTVKDISGDSGLRISFDAGGRRIEKDGLGYLQPAGGYRVRVIVESNYDVDSQVDY